MNGGANGSNTDEDMNDLFRSFLVDGEDLLAVSGNNNNNHSGGSQAAMAAPSDLSPPAGFCLRVGVSAGGGGGGVRVGGGGGGYEADGGSGPMRRRANTSPDCEDIATSSTPVRDCVTLRAVFRLFCRVAWLWFCLLPPVLLSLVADSLFCCGFTQGRILRLEKVARATDRSCEVGRKPQRQPRILKGDNTWGATLSSPSWIKNRGFKCILW